MKNRIRKVYTILQVIFLVTITFFIGSGVNEKSIHSLNAQGNLTLDLSAMYAKVQENIKSDLYASKGSYSGYLTGYIATCPLCTGYLYCNDDYDVLHGQTTYNDATYGEVAIVASSSKFPCGTILRVNTNRVDSGVLYAVVMDRGVGGNSLDLLVPNESRAYTVGRSIVSYDVLRTGW